ncbi:MAG: Ig-like domain-containing protein, partial [Fidelibacterota bacterium]
MTPVSPPRSSVIIRSLLLGGTLFGIFSAIRCTVEEETFVGPTDDSTKYLIFESLTSTRNRLFSQGDTCTVTLRIVDSSNEAKQGIDVRFSATLGTIASRDTTDSSGTASALYTSGDASGIEKITVRAGVKEDSLFLLIIDLASQVSAWSDTTNILADGESTVRIHAAVTDERGIELPGVDVYFSTNRGNITRSSVTDENGQTHAVLTSSPDTVDVEATVVASLEPSGGGLLRLPGELPSDPADGGPGPSQRAHRQASPSEITLHRDKFNLDTKRPSVEEPAGEPGQWQLADSLVITFEGITIDLRPDRAQLVANGEDETQITVTVLESSSGNPVADKSFRSTTTMGTIMGEGNTDGSGRGTLQLRSGTQPGTADITVTVGTGVSSTLQIPFISVHPTSLELSASSSSILADGESAATLTAQVIDTLGNPVAGATVEFGTDLGSLIALSVETDGKGEAQVAITSAAN